MPDGNAARVPYCRRPGYVTANIRSRHRSTANPSTLTRLLWRIRDRGFAMGPATRIETLTDHFTVRFGQRHAGVCGETKKILHIFRCLSVFCPCFVRVRSIAPPQKTVFSFVAMIDFADSLRKIGWEVKKTHSARAPASGARQCFLPDKTDTQDLQIPVRRAKLMPSFRNEHNRRDGI